MNVVLWIAEILLAGVFLFTGATKLLAYEELVRMVERRSKGGGMGMTRVQAGLVGVVEIAGAVGVIVAAAIPSLDPWPPYGLLRLTAGALGLLMVIAGVYHLRRQESATPSVVMFLLALFVIVGRWPMSPHP